MISAAIHFAPVPARLLPLCLDGLVLSTVAAQLAVPMTCTQNLPLWIKLWKLWIAVDSCVGVAGASGGPHRRQGYPRVISCHQAAALLRCAQAVCSS
jgi:hypothetical protein